MERRAKVELFEQLRRSQVNMSYDVMGRMVSRTNPFPQGGTPAPATTYEYDQLGRLTVTTLQDGWFWQPGLAPFGHLIWPHL